MLKAKVFLIALIFGCVEPVFAQSKYRGIIDFQIRNFGYDFGLGVQQPSPLENLQKDIGLRIGSVNHPNEVFVINQVLPASEPFIMDKVARVWAVKPYHSWRWAISKHRSRFDVGVELFGAVKLPLAYSGLYTYGLRIFSVLLMGIRRLNTIRTFIHQKILEGRFLIPVALKRGSGYRVLERPLVYL